MRRQNLSDGYCYFRNLTIIRNKKGTDNLVANHISRLPMLCLQNCLQLSIFGRTTICNLEGVLVHWHCQLPFNEEDTHELVDTVQIQISLPTKYFYWDDLFLWKYCSDLIFRRYIPEEKDRSVLSFFHDQACRGHSGLERLSRRSYNVDFVGWSYLKMLMNFASVALAVNIRVELQRETWC